MARQQGKPTPGPGKPRLRCAIYTRKSTEEGLDQEFNSLDAQYEACASYILSQRHEGWTLLPGRYDDGGFTGGNMERPGLKRLMAEVGAGRIDVIVVYKVDRLTRSLADFAKIVDVLDNAGASFVSITQAFNTTTSMGRLTLNVLLSFAQFEREVISERVRDKVAASKKKGMWMGGPVPLGYEVKNRKLIVDEGEAATIRHIMQRYLDLGSVPALMDELRRTGIVTKQQTLRDGSIRGGGPFVRGPLHHLLKNRIYLGQIVHHGTAYPGEHDAIVPTDLFDAVQAQLAANIGDRRSGKQIRSPSLLTGMIRDAANRPMSPSHAVKGQQRYRYYVSNEATSAESVTAAMRLPAPEIEAAVIRAATAVITNEHLLDSNEELTTHRLQRLGRERAKLAGTLSSGFTSEQRALLGGMDLRVVIYADRIDASCCRARLLEMLGEAGEAGDPRHAEDRLPLRIASSVRRYGHELRLRLDSADERHRDPKLMQLLVRAWRARDALLTPGEMTLNPHERRELKRLARMAYLAPDIITAILDGSQPVTLRARQLERMGNVPMDWQAQRQALGFAAA